MAEANAAERAPLINSLVSSFGATSSFANISVDVSKQFVETPEDGKVPMFIVFGPGLKLKRVLRLYYFVLIYVFYRFYYKNAGTLMTTMLSASFYPNGSNESSSAGDPFHYDHPYLNFLLKMFQYIIPSFLSVIFAFASDYAKYQKAYLLNYSLGISSFAAFVITMCGYVLSVRQLALLFVLDNIGLPLHKILSVLGLISFDIGLALFLPISLAYGLDILQGTKSKVRYLYFPLMYVANNVGTGFSFLRYLDTPSSHLNRNSLVCLVVVIIAWVLFIIGRGFRILPDYKAIGDDFTINEGIQIFCYALKKRLKGTKSPTGHWFIQLGSDLNSGKYRHDKVQKVSSFFKINFSLTLLLLIFSAVQVLETVFPQQGYTLNIPSVNQTAMYCKEQTKPYLNNLSFINNFTIIICTPLFEFFFWNVSFKQKNPTDDLKFNAKCKSIKRISKTIRGYFQPIDPTLKKIFWGLFFGLASILCALLVEVVRIVTLGNNQHLINCAQFGFQHTYRISGISIFSQIPQYAIGSLLEVLCLIGIQQFVYFHCYSTFKESFKGFFLGLYYFYFSLGSMLANITLSILDRLCQRKNECQHCFIYNDSCSDNEFRLTTVIWAALILVYLVIILFFGLFSHYRHYLIKTLLMQRENFIDELTDDKDLIEG